MLKKKVKLVWVAVAQEHTGALQRFRYVSFLIKNCGSDSHSESAHGFSSPHMTPFFSDDSWHGLFLTSCRLVSFYN